MIKRNVKQSYVRYYIPTPSCVLGKMCVVIICLILPGKYLRLNNSTIRKKVIETQGEYNHYKTIVIGRI